MNYLLGVEHALLTDVGKIYNELKTIDDKTMKGLAHFYGYDSVLHALDLLKHTKRLILFYTNEKPSRRLYQFKGNKSQLPVFTLSTSNYCTCTFYKEQILIKHNYFACPHNIAIKLYETIFTTMNDIEIEAFDVPYDYLIDKISKLIEQSCELE